MTNKCENCCQTVKRLPTFLVLLLVLLLQATCLDYYLVTYIDLSWAAFAAADVVSLNLFILTYCFQLKFYRDLNNASSQEKGHGTPIHTRLGTAAWFIYTSILCVKVAYTFKHFSRKLDEDNFFGPNTLKTTTALTAIIFLLFLSILHETRPNSHQRMYIDELTGTVMFDILDGVDAMDILFDEEAYQNILPSLDDTIIALACINFLLPTIPFITLAKTRSGHKKLSMKMVLLYKVLLAYLVNLPLLVTRMIIWHGMNEGISIFSLKNIIIIGMVSYNCYEFWKSEDAKTNSSYSLQDRSDM